MTRLSEALNDALKTSSDDRRRSGAFERRSRPPQPAWQFAPRRDDARRRRSRRRAERRAVDRRGRRPAGVGASAEPPPTAPLGADLAPRRTPTATSWSSATGVDPRAGRAVPASRRRVASRAGTSPACRSVMVTSALPIGRQDADRDQPRADAERVVSAARAADRRRSAPAAHARDVCAAAERRA